MHLAPLLALALIAAPALAADAPSLTLLVRGHPSEVVENGERHTGYTLFTDERLIVEVQLDLYPGTDPPPSAWPAGIRWTLESRAAGVELPLARPRLVTQSLQDTVKMGPYPALECRTLRAVLDFGAIYKGDYALTATDAGLSSSFTFVVRPRQ